MTTLRVQKLISSFGNTYARFDLFYDDPQGAYVFSDLIYVSNFFNSLVQNKLISIGQSFLETGCGDGRIVALANIIGLNAFGVELNKKLVEESKLKLKDLKRDKVLNSVPIIENGDFLNSSVYSKLGKTFSSFDIVFNFHTNVERLSKKFKIESSKKSILILSLLSKKPYVIKNLDLEFSFQQDNRSTEVFFVYKKSKLD